MCDADIFIQEDAYEKVVYEMAAILSRPQCINPPGTETGLFRDDPINSSCFLWHQVIGSHDIDNISMG